MASPVIAASAASANVGNTTSHTVSLPTGIVAGSLVEVAFVCDSDGATTVTFPAGWTAVFDVQGVDVKAVYYWRECDGSEGSTITVTTNDSEESEHQSYRITGAADPDTQPPEATTTAHDTASNTHNPASLSPTGGSKDYLWICGLGYDGGTSMFDGDGVMDSNYTELGEAASGGTAGCGIIVGQRANTAASEDPTVFDLDSTTTRTAISFLVANHPAAVSNDRVARVTWAEAEVPTAPRLARVTWAEMSVPDAPRQARVTWAEMETPDGARLGRVTWAELEVPNAPRLARVTWAEMEVSDAPRLARVTWVEMEAPDITTDRQAFVTWAEMESPSASRLARVTWAEMEVADAPRLARVTWAELETPPAERARVTWAEMEVPSVAGGEPMHFLLILHVG